MCRQGGLTPILKKVEQTDALILGSPIYFGNVSGEMRSFMERLLFPFFPYTDPPQSLFHKKIPTAFIYTMNVTEEQMKEWGYQQFIDHNQRLLQMVFGASESLCSFDTLQFKDYSKVWPTALIRRGKQRGIRNSFPWIVRRLWRWG